MFEVVVEGAADAVRGECSEGFFGGLALDVRGVVLGGVPDVFDGVVVGCVRWQENRGDVLQHLAGLVETGQHLDVVGSGVVQEDRDLLCLGFSLEPVQCEDCLLGVLVRFDRVQLWRS